MPGTERYQLCAPLGGHQFNSRQFVSVMLLLPWLQLLYLRVALLVVVIVETETAAIGWLVSPLYRKRDVVWADVAVVHGVTVHRVTPRVPNNGLLRCDRVPC